MLKNKKSLKKLNKIKQNKTISSGKSRFQTQVQLLPKNSLAYGGSLLTKRAARQNARPLSTRHSMHLVLRSSQAINNWSFKHAKNRDKIRNIINNFANKYAVQILSIANVGTHLHIHMQLKNRLAYKPFIRAVTAAIAMAVTGASRWSKIPKMKFWDRRPFTRIIIGRRAFLNIKEYIKINALEALGFNRTNARLFLAWRYDFKQFWKYDQRTIQKCHQGSLARLNSG
jgi:REP element-mobilizing transposase RayT